MLSFTGAYTNITWTPDNQLISDQDNRLNLINPQIAAKTTIATEEGHPSGDPSACADGRYVVFVLGFHGNSSHQNIWRVDATGGNLKQLTDGKFDTYPVCSPDGRSVYYITEREEDKLARVSIDGGESKILSDQPVSETARTIEVSPDGKLVAFPTLEHSGEHKEKLALVETDTGQTTVKDLDRLRFGMVHFSQDGKAVIYPARENGVDNLWQQPLDESPGRALTSFKSEHIWDFHWSRDGTKLALVRGHTDSDVVLIRDAQQ
jgi:Tol biopolymer transport system component